MRYHTNGRGCLSAYILNNTQALLNLSSATNAMNLAYAAQLGLLVKKTELELRKSMAPP